MDFGGGDGWCVQRCAGGAHDKSSTMLRFRPIAPKPASGGGTPLPDSNSLNSSKGRRKRKYVRVRRNSGYRRLKKEPPGQDQEGGLEKRIVTLQLLPERVDRREPFWCSFDGTVRTEVGVGVGVVQDPPMWLSCENRRDAESCKLIDRTEENGYKTVESLVTVECVTDTCMDALVREEVRSTDVEILKKDLEGDKCPAMISDGVNRVEWVNGAYRKMVRQGNDSELRVGLVVKEKLPSHVSDYHRGFSCRVRVEYYYCMTTKKVDQWTKMVVPCDVWKMDGGGFAWRLDTEAALSLGR